MKRTKTIKVDYLARVEGEGGLFVKLKDNQVVDVKLKIFEPPRFFEAFLRGRQFTEAHDITARICGICPVAYQMSAVHAMEDAIGLKVEPAIRELRRLLYCGEWIESHGLHVYMLHAPDFLGYDDAIRMAQDHGAEVERGLRLKKAGNDIVNLIGGREIHPINVRIGGFYKIPRKQDLNELAEKLKQARDDAIETAKWVSTFDFPDFDLDYNFVALRHPDEYPFNEGQLVSNQGLCIDVSDYEKYFEEQHLAHSNALHSVQKDVGAYFVGPMARFALNFDRLTQTCQELARQTGVENHFTNPFKSIIIRSIEMVYACEEAIRVLENFQRPDRPYLEAEPRTGVGYACTEAPRGILYHRYRLQANGEILDAKIVPPTSQNQKQIETDLWHFIPQHLDQSDEKLQWQCEQAIRNYDPCISCATHFLKLDVERS
jgi:coenzyme F420-reducing hydrogenase alpha subunit